MRLLAIDPGPEQSAYAYLDSGTVRLHAKVDNAELLVYLRTPPVDSANPHDHVVVEAIASYGMPVGAEVFETVWWAGRFHEAAVRSGVTASRLKRKEVMHHLCGSSKGNDATIRQALIDRFGPGKEKAIGRKKTPGPLYGISGDEWSALAVAVTYADLNRGEDDGIPF